LNNMTTMNPEQILAALTAVYAQCSSYRDSGKVVTRFIYVDDNNPPFTSVKPFSTAFVRPDSFRFEYQDEHGRYLVWANGEVVRTWWDVTAKLGEEESLEMALGVATGVSDGSSHTVPALLMADRIESFGLVDVAGLVSLGEESLDGVACYRLQGPPPTELRKAEVEERCPDADVERSKSGPLTLWIDRDKLLLRRIEEQTEFETFRTERVTTYEPAVGFPVGEDELRFDPPSNRRLRRIRSIWVALTGRVNLLLIRHRWIWFAFAFALALGWLLLGWLVLTLLRMLAW
jgi:hypothetical protein